MAGRTWDANSYDTVGSPMTEMATAVLERLELRGDETVLDAGCGTGRVTELLLERLPRGRVIAVDADADMVKVARENLGLSHGGAQSTHQEGAPARVDVRQADLLDLDLTTLGVDEPVDAVLSTATFHWVLDHSKLFQNLSDVLRPGGRLVAQCGGEGNISDLRAAGDDVAKLSQFAPYFEGWSAPWFYANPEDTVDRLKAAGFDNISVWLQPWPVRPADPAQYMATVTMGAQVQRLPEDLRSAYVDAVLERVRDSSTVDYVRLNIDASKLA